VVDALDLCYTKSHVNTFVIISGDSDFSPLVSKLRENNKQVIGVGVKQSTSDLLIANCDEFIFYDDLVRENQRAQARRQNPGSNPPPAPRRSPEEERSRKESQDARRTQGVELAAETFEALLSERGDTGKIWASVLKEAIKRRKPDFSEGRYGFRTFGNLLEEAQARGLLEFGRDEKSGAYVYRSHGVSSGASTPARPEGAGERASQGGATRHDFHAVATAPDLRSDAGEGQGASGRNRGRRSEGTDRADRVDTHPTQRNEQHESEQADTPSDRPASRYFSQPVTPESAPLEPVIDSTPEQDARAEALDGSEAPAGPIPPENDGAEPAAPRRSRARSGGGAKPAASAPKAAATPRARGARAVADAGGAASADASASAAEAPAAEAPGAAPTKAAAPRPRSRARKPAAKPAE